MITSSNIKRGRSHVQALRKYYVPLLPCYYLRRYLDCLLLPSYHYITFVCSTRFNLRIRVSLAYEFQSEIDVRLFTLGD